ncbi:MAG: hypothetical protein ACE5F1_10410 [Planctomycetota bacterium]
MSIHKNFLLAALFTCSVLPAQTQTIRGKVENVRNTTNRFFLDCTTIPVVSRNLNLNLLVGQHSILSVANVGTPTSPVLDVRAATPTVKVFDMGNLILNKSGRWSVNGTPGSIAVVFLTATPQTGYLPLGPAGAWFLGLSVAPIAGGVIASHGQFGFSILMPNLPGLVGKSFSGQAATVTGRSFLLSNPDCRAVRSR